MGIKTEIRGGVFELVLDRPPANALDAATNRALTEAFETFARNPDLRVALITGSGDKFFCAGWDMKALEDAAAAGDDGGAIDGARALANVGKPVIAAVSGVACGGGFELALAADLIIAGEDARFSLPEISAGLLAEFAVTELPRCLPRHVALDLLLTGRWMEADEAARYGLVKEVAPTAGVLSRARALAERLAAGPPLAHAAIKDVMAETGHLPPAQARALLEEKGLPSLSVLATSEDVREGARAFAERREPVWRGR